MRQFTIGIDGYNLAMPRGTWIATYGLNLARTLQAAGHRVVGVFGLLVLEAMSLGMPVLTGNGSSLSEVRVTRRCWSIRTAPPRSPPASPGWTAMRGCASSWQQQGRSRRNLGSYEKLRVLQEFAAKNYAATVAGLVKAQGDATRQQLYIVRVVDANMPVSRCSRSGRASC